MDSGTSLVLASAVMYVMSSVMRGARRIAHADQTLLSTYLSLPLLCPARRPGPLLTCQHNRKYASKQVSQRTFAEPS